MNAVMHSVARGWHGDGNGREESALVREGDQTLITEEGTEEEKGQRRTFN